MEVAIELSKIFGPMGFLMFMMWRFQNDTIPRLTRESHEAQKRQRQDFRDEAALQRQDFREMSAQQRADFERMMKREQDLNAENTAKIVDAIGRAPAT